MRSAVILYLVALLGLAGCKMNVKAELYTADIREVIEGKETKAQIDIAFQARQKDCDRIESQVVDVLKREYEDAQFAGCKKQNYFHMAVFRVSAPIKMIDGFDAATTRTQKPIGIGVIEYTKVKGRYALMFLVNKDAMKRMMNLLPEDMSRMARFMDRGDTKFKAVISNDERKPAEFFTYGSFVNNRPITRPRTYSLKRREHIEIALSDVANMALNTWASQTYIGTWELGK